MKLIYQLIKYFWFILILSVGLGQELTGCMDDGNQQWSPNPGSPACNYDPDADEIIIEGDCLYNDCNGVCGGPDVVDCEGVCGGNDSTCNDCNGAPNGSAYMDACGFCIGGTTEADDCFIMDFGIDSVISMESISIDTFHVYVKNLESLISIDIDLLYDATILKIKDINTYGTALETFDYKLAYENYSEGSDSIRVIISLYFEPHNNHEIFSFNGKEDILIITIETLDIYFEDDDTETPLIIQNLSVNEKLMNNSNWEGNSITISLPKGCIDPEACNYDPDARKDDGTCAYEIDCFGECGGDAVYDVCEECDGNELDIDNCICTGANIQYDCIGDCPPFGGCPDEFSIVEGCAQVDDCEVCVGGLTDRNPCTEDCTGDLGGTAYLDNCGQCIAELADDDCFDARFNIYNLVGEEIENFIIKEGDSTFYVAISTTNLPTNLEGIDLKIDFDNDIIKLDNWSLISDSLNPVLIIQGLLENSYTMVVDTNNIDYGWFVASIYYNPDPEANNESISLGDGNILFFEFSPNTENGDSTTIDFSRIHINERVMDEEQDYTSQEIFFGDCTGIFNGDAVFDECGVCGGDGPTAGLNCDGEPLSLNESLISQNFTLSQNYPNPFNPITYIQYSVPQFDFVTIEIINISGQIIKTIVQSSHQPGNYEIMWNGTNQNGISVPSGIYFYKLDVAEFISVKKLVLLK